MTKILSLLLVVSVMISCNDDDETTNQVTTNTIVDIAAATPNLSILVDALNRTNLAGTVAAADPITVLAPTNDAFESFLSDNNFGSLNEVPTDVLAQVLLNHVINGDIRSTDLSTGFAKTLATSSAANDNMSIYVDTSNGVRFNGVSSVSTANVVADNGVVHIVDAVIGLPTIATFATANADLSNLVAALSSANLVSVVADASQSLTVLAPGNDAFGRFLTNNNFSGLGDIPADLLSNVLLNHVINGSVKSTDLSTSYASTLATSDASRSPMSIYINTDNGVSFNGVSDVVSADIIAENGVIHAVNEVIGLPDIVTFATADPNFSTLVAALTREDLTTNFVDILSTPTGTAPAPFTVFAPTNDAFGALVTELSISGLGDLDATTLANTLTYHVVGEANVIASQLSDNLTVNTLGGPLTANVSGGATLTDTRGRVTDIVATDVQANNGVIHVINRVVLQ